MHTHRHIHKHSPLHNILEEHAAKKVFLFLEIRYYITQPTIENGVIWSLPLEIAYIFGEIKQL